MFEQLSSIYHIDPVIILLVLAAGFFQKQYMQELLPKVSGALKTLLISFLFFITYIMAMAYAGKLHRDFLVTYLVSYCLATSFYELLLKKFLSKLGPDQDPQPRI